MAKQWLNRIMIPIAILCMTCSCREGHSEPEPKVSDRVIEILKDYRITAAEARYDGTTLEGITDGTITVEEGSSINGIVLLCRGGKDGKAYEFKTGNLHAGGDLYNINLVEASYGSLSIDEEKKYPRLHITVRGQIKEKLYDTASSQERPAFDCDIHMQCEVDDKELNIKITAIEP